jgi:HAD superfamily hydrolase (TIGR01509 family)
MSTGLNKLKNLFKKNRIERMIKLVIFDLDGVLINSANIHYESLNKALVKNGIEPISYDDHISKYNGLSTKNKLDLLLKNSEELSKELSIIKDKQDLTTKAFRDLVINNEVYEIINYLQSSGIKVWICSNCVRATVQIIVEKLLKRGIVIDGYLSNEDTSSHKPDPEIYNKCIGLNKLDPNEVLIFEDSLIGINAAIKSQCIVCPVHNIDEMTMEFVKNVVNGVGENDVSGEKLLRKVRIPNLTIIIPMAGMGSRFKEKGYINPKPFINVNGKFMINVVVDNLGFIPDKFIFIVRKEHEEYIKELKKTEEIISMEKAGCKIKFIYADKLTEGAACTVLLAKSEIGNEQLIIANSDQFLEWNPCEFLLHGQQFDGCISVFEETEGSLKWSYARIGKNDTVVEVAEKKRISSLATTGIYYYKRGLNFIKSAEQMISKGIRTNNEFYVCPVYNEAIELGLLITTHTCRKMWSLGTPDDLEQYLCINT